MDVTVRQTSSIRLLNLVWCDSDVQIQVNKNGINVRIKGEVLSIALHLSSLSSIVALHQGQLPTFLLSFTSLY